MKRVSRIESDTPIVPRAIAEAVLEEASVWLGEPLPRRWVRELTAEANTVYAHNERFRRKLRGKGSRGRDWLWMFTRHWLCALDLRAAPTSSPAAAPILQHGRSAAEGIGRHLDTQTRWSQDEGVRFMSGRDKG